jgi:hypothetical protein
MRRFGAAIKTFATVFTAWIRHRERISLVCTAKLDPIPLELTRQMRANSLDIFVRNRDVRRMK